MGVVRTRPRSGHPELDHQLRAALGIFPHGPQRYWGSASFGSEPDERLSGWWQQRHSHRRQGGCRTWLIPAKAGHRLSPDR